MSVAQEPLTLARVERALDRLAMIMTDIPDLGHRLLPLYEKLDREAEAMRKQEDTLSAVRARATRLRDQTLARS